MINTKTKDELLPFVKILKNGVITLPKGIRKTLDIHDGEILEVRVKKSEIILTPKLLVNVPIGEKLSENGIKLVNEALKDIEKGNVKSFSNVDDLIKDLNS